MRTTRTRHRSFMAAVIGGALGAGALAVVANSASAQPKNDVDQGSTVDPAGSDPAPRTDADPGTSTSDAAGHDPARAPSTDPAGTGDPRGGTDPEPGTPSTRPKRPGR
jgi:hypothetical protein